MLHKPFLNKYLVNTPYYRVEAAACNFRPPPVDTSSLKIFFFWDPEMYIFLATEPIYKFKMSIVLFLIISAWKQSSKKFPPLQFNQEFSQVQIGHKV